MRDPTGFTYSDELTHSYNVDRIVTTHHLISPNPLLPVTPHYPGLETVTAAFRLFGGTTTFASGVAVVALARVLMMIALFLVYEIVSGSARLAALGTLLYTVNPNFVYFDAEFSYESLALPIALVAVYAVLQWVALKRTDPVEVDGASRLRRRAAWGTMGFVTTATVVVTHHVTSYLLVGFLLAAGRGLREIDPLRKRFGSTAPFALFGGLLILFWVVLTARTTWNYLTPVLSTAVGSLLDLVTGRAGARQLFSAPSTATAGHVIATPFWDRWIAIVAAVLTAVGLPFGLWRVWKDHRRNVLLVILALAGAAYVGSLGMRIVPNAWEIANRASEFLFIGAGIVLALAGLERFRPRVMPRLGAVALSLAFAITLCGGMIAGWSWDLILAQTDQVAVQGTTIRPPGMLAADWARTVLGPGKNFAADASNARLLLAYADEFPLAGGNPDFHAVIRDPRVDAWHVRLLRQYSIAYILVDRRVVSEDELAGYFFATSSSIPTRRLMFDDPSVHKFDSLSKVSRVWDSGDAVIYDIRKLSGAP
jgi:hypothetical protein